jgi:hypothetical protein
VSEDLAYESWAALAAPPRDARSRDPSGAVQARAHDRRGRIGRTRDVVRRKERVEHKWGGGGATTVTKVRGDGPTYSAEGGSTVAAQCHRQRTLARSERCRAAGASAWRTRRRGDTRQAAAHEGDRMSRLPEGPCQYHETCLRLLRSLNYELRNVSNDRSAPFSLKRIRLSRSAPSGRRSLSGRERKQKTQARRSGGWLTT